MVHQHLPCSNAETMGKTSAGQHFLHPQRKTHHSGAQQNQHFNNDSKKTKTTVQQYKSTHPDSIYRTKPTVSNTLSSVKNLK